MELPLLLEDLSLTGMTSGDTRVVLNRQTGAVSEVWVRWHEVAFVHHDLEGRPLFVHRCRDKFRVPELGLKRPIVIAFRKNRRRSSAVQAFIEFLKNYKAQ